MNRIIIMTAIAAALTVAPRARGDTIGTAGVGVTAVQIGASPRLAITPSGEVGVRSGAWAVSLRDQLSFMPPAFGGGDTSVSVHNRTSVGGGYQSARFAAAVGASLAQYAMTACSTTLCGRVVGVAPGADLSIDYYPLDDRSWLGARVAASVGWYGGGSDVLGDAWSVMVTAGPVFRFGGVR